MHPRSWPPQVSAPQDPCGPGSPHPRSPAAPAPHPRSPAAPAPRPGIPAAPAPRPGSRRPEVSPPRGPAAKVLALTMLPRVSLFLLLLSGLHAENNVKEVQAMVGSDVVLSCIHPNQSHFDLNDLFVYWQISNSNTVVTYYLSENKSENHKDSHYKNRSHMLLDRMKQGDFSLYLKNVTPQDTQKFKCLVFWKSTLTRALKEEVRLHVAANFSMPVVSSSPSQGQELTFTCMSTNGYPKPNLYWINKTDNSLMDETLQNSTVSLNERGLYDVVSILRIPWALHVNVGCCVENVVLQQNLTSISQAETSIGKKDMFTEIPQGSHEEKNVTFFSILAVLLVAAVATLGWACRSRCPHRSYTGAPTVVLEHGLTDHA